MPQVDKFKSILQDHNDTPDVQNRMKVAFAEGYAAHNKRDADPSTSWTRRGIKIVFYAVLIWIAFQLIQGYSPLGGSEFYRFSVQHNILTLLVESFAR